MSDLFINKSVWTTFTPSERSDYVDRVFKHYRTSGFPYFPTNGHYRAEEFRKLMQYDVHDIIQGDVVRQTMHGLALAWSYMPHSWSVPCNNKLTPEQLFADDALLRKVIIKRMSMGDNMSDNGLRKMLKLYSGAQCVSNFRPTAAAALYLAFAGVGATVLDMSCGYGGRLLGAIRAGVHYIGFEPCVETFDGLHQLAADFSSHDQDVDLFLAGSETMELSNEVDFAFTSPPYFDTEKYSADATQSYIKFPTKKEWVDGFLFETLRRTHRALRNNGMMAINVQDVPNFKNLCEVLRRTAETAGFELYGNIRLALSNPRMNNEKSAFKHEPIFIFRKKHV